MVTGLILGFLMSTLVSSSACNRPSSGPAVMPSAQELTAEQDACIQGLKYYGFPIKYSSENVLSNGVIYRVASDDVVTVIEQNVFFWILVSFILLFIIRHFKRNKRENF